MNNSTQIVLTIKAANQKCDDFILECDSNWSIRYLKSHLSKYYPAKPNEQTIRLIYSGRLLNDDSELKDCFRLNSESNIQSHTIHIVYKSSNNNDDETNNNLDTQNEGNDFINAEIQNLTQSMNSQQQQQQILNNLEQMSPKDRHAYIYNHLKSYYERMGMPISNSWNISYLHHTALYYQMYSNYIQSIGISPPLIPINSNVNPVNSNIEPNLNETQVILNNQQQVPIVNNNNVDDLRAEERDDDWLSILHNFCSFLVLFSIVYFYSTLTRFIIVIIVVILLYVYHAGWFSLERRINIRNVANRPNNPQPQNQEPQNNAENNNNQDVNQGGDDVTNPNIFRLVFSFIITFFTSLIPERARIPN